MRFSCRLVLLEKILQCASDTSFYNIHIAGRGTLSCYMGGELLDQEPQRPGINGWHDRTALVAI